MRFFLLLFLVVSKLGLSASTEKICFLVLDSNTGKEVLRMGGSLCAKPFPACSTFKVPLSLIAFDEGLLKDSKTVLKWDGVRHSMPEWNQDQFASDWMQRSVVWFSQRLTPQIGEKKLVSRLKEFGYGNADLSGGLTDAWLPHKGHATLLISAEEQAKFFRKFWRAKLPVSKHAIETTQAIVPQVVDGSTKLNGKTGSGYSNGETIGWYVGHMERNGKNYDFATLLTRESSTPPQNPAGPEARAKTLELLKKVTP